MVKITTSFVIGRKTLAFMERVEITTTIEDEKKTSKTQERERAESREEKLQFVQLGSSYPIFIKSAIGGSNVIELAPNLLGNDS
uniref:Uncharacterized protein n=1 Tax=Oryza sativa subsp. japonica TaxID=39947 RepID=Q6H7L9_ORYSJ|nr:hypothetical protein [Oryza sativa Japonica Group]